MIIRMQILASIGSLMLFVAIFQLVRTRRLRVQYSILWFLTVAVLLLFSIWTRVLDSLSRAVGIYYSPSLLFLVAFLFLLLIVLHFSVVISRLAERNRELAQKLALLNWRVEELKKELPGKFRAKGATTDEP